MPLFVLLLVVFLIPQIADASADKSAVTKEARSLVSELLMVKQKEADNLLPKNYAHFSQKQMIDELKDVSKDAEKENPQVAKVITGIDERTTTDDLKAKKAALEKMEAEDERAP